MYAESPVKWTGEMTLVLICLYKNYECLWNRNSVNYRNRSMKMEAVKAISTELGLDSGEILRKLHNLRCQLNSEIRKVVKKRNAGINYHSSWELFDTLLFISEVRIPEVKHVDGRPCSPARTRPLLRTYKSLKKVDIKREVLDHLIDVKYEIEDNYALYPDVQLVTESSQSTVEHQVATLFASDDVEPTCSEPNLKRMRESVPDDYLAVSSDDSIMCTTPDVFVGNPMADNSEDDARALGDFVAAEMSRIRSDERRSALKKTIEEAVKAMVEEDEKEFLQDPATDPLC